MIVSENSAGRLKMEDMNFNQMVQLELADIVHKICKEEKIQYTLLSDSIAAWKECGGFAPFLEHITVGMLYPCFLQFIAACKKRLCETEYFIINCENCEQFNELWIRMAKKSRVVLPEERKKDEVYYAYYIDIVPIFYVGNTKKELEDIKKQYTCYRRCLWARKVLSGTINIKNCVKIAKNSYYYFQKRKFTFEKLEKLITGYGEEKTKYVFIPSLMIHKGISCLAETYSHLQEIVFDGHIYTIMQNAEQWLKDYYNAKQYEKLISRQVNQVNVVGPEIMRRIQLIELDMLREFDRICRKYGLKYVLYSGTLLGAVRHGGFIPWDDDIDVAMLYEDYVKFIEIAPGELDSEKFFLKTQKTDKDCNITFIQLKRNNTVYCREMRDGFNTHPGVFIDILPLFNGSNSKIVHKIQHKMCKFYKTMVWSHLGAISAKKGKGYYMLLSKVSNKKAYEKYMKWATLVKKPGDKLAYLSFLRDPYNAVYTRRETYINIKEMNFEGYPFYVPANVKEVLCSMYSEDYMKYPPLSGRVAKHLPAIIEIGDLYEWKEQI